MQQQASELEDFSRVIAPLEQKQGRRLGGPGRAACIRAFREYPDGFKSVAADSLERGRQPLALLIQMVKDGDHQAEPLKAFEVGFWIVEENESGHDVSRQGAPVETFATEPEARRWSMKNEGSYFRAITPAPAASESDGYGPYRLLQPGETS